MTIYAIVPLAKGYLVENSNRPWLNAWFETLDEILDEIKKWEADESK